MFKIYSKGCEYAIRALTRIPPEKFDQKFSAKEICKEAGIPESYSRKIFQGLVREKILTAVTGPGGGYTFSRPPKEISFLNIIHAVDGKDAFDRCVMGLSQCSGGHPCPVHDTWGKVKTLMVKEMNKKTLPDLMKLAQNGNGRSIKRKMKGKK